MTFSQLLAVMLNDRLKILRSHIKTSTNKKVMKNSLVHMEDSVQIDAPIKVVFAYLTDFRNTSNWHKNMKR